MNILLGNIQLNYGQNNMLRSKTHYTKKSK